jgi:dihydrofolate synthase/folylpolyglutamate synthase
MRAIEEVLRREFFGIKLGLDSMRELCAALGSPQLSSPTIIVAGTNGKGSVTAMVATALRAAGWRVGRYTSPHLVELRERIAIDGAPIGEADLERAATAVLGAEAALRASGAIASPMTFFELTTAAAFESFRRAGVDVAVIEVGLGGRFDATNVVSPAVSVITTIDLDHVDHLGHTLASIAFEKAGVMRAGTPAVIGALHPEARAAIEEVSGALGAPLVDALAGTATSAELDTSGRTRLSLSTPTRDFDTLTLSLRGRHQVDNAIVAARVLETIDRVTPVRVPADAIRAGLETTDWPGRLDVREVGGDRCVLLDAAHNPAGAAALANYLREARMAPLPCVFGVMRDKDAAPMLRALADVTTQFVFTQATTRRARPADELPAIAREAGVMVPAVVEVAPEIALRRAWERAPAVCATGSIFLVGDVLQLIATSRLAR